MSRRTIAAILATAALVGTTLPTASAMTFPGGSSLGQSSIGSSPVGEWGSPLPDQPRISVNADGTMGGNDGCNVFSTTWRSEGQVMIIETDEWVSTMKYCGWEWFPAARSALVDGPVMRVHDEHGAVIGILLRQ